MMVVSSHRSYHSGERLDILIPCLNLDIIILIGAICSYKVIKIEVVGNKCIGKRKRATLNYGWIIMCFRKGGATSKLQILCQFFSTNL